MFFGIIGGGKEKQMRMDAIALAMAIDDEINDEEKREAASINFSFNFSEKNLKEIYEKSEKLKYDEYAKFKIVISLSNYILENKKYYLLDIIEKIINSDNIKNEKENELLNRIFKILGEKR